MSDINFLNNYFNDLKNLIDNEKYLKDLISVKEILPPACQASIGVQTLNENSEIIKLISQVNNHNSSRVGLAERKVLETLEANCNSPIGVLGNIDSKNNFNIRVELYSHDGQEKYAAEVNGKLENSLQLAKDVGNIIINKVGIDYIKKLDVLKNDFNYTP